MNSKWAIVSLAIVFIAILMVMLILCPTKARAFGDNSYSSEEADKHQWGFKPRSWEEVKPEPQVAVDRSIVSYENDPTILISLPRVKKETSEPKVVTRIVYRNRPVEQGVKVSAQLCDEETGSCGEVK